MTPPVPPSRTSTTIRFVEAIGSSLRSILVGLMLFVPGAWFFYVEINEATPGEKIHAGHLWIAVGLMVAGGIAIQPPFGDKLTSIFIAVVPYIPIIGGKRAGDLPPTEPPKAP